MSAGDLLSLFGQSAGGTAVVFVILLITGMIVPKGTYDEMREQRDEWKKTAEANAARAEVNAARAEAGVIAGQVVKDAMLGLRKELE